MRVGGARCVPSARELAGALPPFRGVRSHAPPATSRPVAVVPRPVVAAPSMRILMCIRPKCAAPATSSLIGTGAGHCEGFTPRSTNGFEHRILRRQGSRREELWAPANLLLRQRGPEARGVLVGPVINVRRGRLRRPARPPRWSGSAIGNETHADAPWSAMPNGHARLADQALLGNARPLALRTDPEHALGDLHGVGAFPFRRFSPDANTTNPFSSAGTCRTRPTSTSSMPAARSGVGYSRDHGSSRTRSRGRPRGRGAPPPESPRAADSARARPSARRARVRGRRWRARGAPARGASSASRLPFSSSVEMSLPSRNVSHCGKRLNAGTCGASSGAGRSSGSWPRSASAWSAALRARSRNSAMPSRPTAFDRLDPIRRPAACVSASAVSARDRSPWAENGAVCRTQAGVGRRRVRPAQR
jgi:hypothetical protein